MDRNETEQLAQGMKALRDAARNRRSSVESREFLMARFAAQDRVIAMPRRYWALVAAAALVVGLFAVPHRQAGSPVAPGADSAAQQVQTTFEAPADPEAEGFVAVPYVPPLAAGEMLRVVHTELDPAALTSLGVNVDPSWTSQLPADLLMGEDGMPRAVRVAEVAAGGGF